MMTPALAILCYHRIVDADELDAAWPYLERGTAVRTETFVAQLADLARFADVLAEDAALEVLAGRRRLTRAAVWLTFDDGYRDVLRAAPRVITGTVFVTTCTAERVLPADAWYAVLVTATRARGELDLGHGRFHYDLSRRAGRARLVNGPERRAYLRGAPSTQEAALRALAATLEPRGEVPRCYLTEAELRDLLGGGWTLGSHGVTHAPFDCLTDEELALEATTSYQALSALGGAVRSIALPDGALPSSLAALRRSGYECALALGDAPAAPGAPVHARFLVPDDPRWVNQVLRPTLEGSARG